MITLNEIATWLDAKLVGLGDVVISRLGTIQGASSDAITFLANSHYRPYLERTKAAAVLCREADAEHCPVPALVVKDPYLAYAKISHRFEVRPELMPGVHATAVIDPSVKVPANAHIGAHVVIEKNVVLGDAVIIMPGCYVGEGVSIGDQTRLWPNVTLYHQVVLGKRCQVHANTVIGSDGFGYAPSKDGWVSIAQVGRVVVGDDVHIGASTTIDRGAVEDTQIGAGVIIDNQVQIAHNVVIGEHTAIAGAAGISGSTKIGRHCLVGGATGIAGHLTITDGVQLSGMSMVTGNITEPGVYASGTSLDDVRSWRKNVVRFRQLNDIYQRLRKLEKE